MNNKTLGVKISDFIQATINSSAYIPLYFTNPNKANGVAPRIHNHDNVSIPKKFLNIKYNNMATITANEEKMNCLIDSPKNIDSLNSLISLLILISITITFPLISFYLFSFLLLYLPTSRVKTLIYFPKYVIIYYVNSS